MNLQNEPFLASPIYTFTFSKDLWSFVRDKMRLYFTMEFEVYWLLAVHKPKYIAWEMMISYAFILYQIHLFLEHEFAYPPRNYFLRIFSEM